MYASVQRVARILPTVRIASYAERVFALFAGRRVEVNFGKIGNNARARLELFRRHCYGSLPLLCCSPSIIEYQQLATGLATSYWRTAARSTALSLSLSPPSTAAAAAANQESVNRILASRRPLIHITLRRIIARDPLCLSVLQDASSPRSERPVL